MLAENFGLKLDQFKCTNGFPCGTCGACGTCEACGTYGAQGLEVEGLEHHALDLLTLTDIMSNLILHYYLSVNV